MAYFANANRIDDNAAAAEKSIPVTADGIAKYLDDQGLNWRVRMVQERHPITGDPLPYYAQMRESDGRIFKTGFSDRFVALQHTDAFTGIVDMAKQQAPSEAPMTIARAGSFDGGRIVFAQADIGHMEIGDGLRQNGGGFRPDAVTRRLTFATPYDGSASMILSITPTRIVCRNTLTMAVGKKADDRISIRHTQSGEDRLKEMATAYQIVGRQFKRTETAFQLLAGKKIGKMDFAQVMDALFPTPKDASNEEKKRINEQKNDVARFYANADDGQTERDTGWNLYNAFTRNTNHHSTVRAVPGDFGTPTKEEARDRSKLFGTIHDKNAEALKVITKTLEIDSDIEKILAMVDVTPRAPEVAQQSMADQILAMMAPN